MGLRGHLPCRERLMALNVRQPASSPGPAPHLIDAILVWWSALAQTNRCPVEASLSQRMRVAMQCMRTYHRTGPGSISLEMRAFFSLEP